MTEPSTAKREILPDSRLQHREVGVIRGPLGNWIPIFCANCGAPGGRVLEGVRFAFWLCDNCYEKWGVVAGLMAVPDEIVWEQMKQRMAERVATLKHRVLQRIAKGGR